MTINYQVSGVQRGFAPPTMGPNGQPVSAPQVYQVTLQLQPDANNPNAFMGASQFTIQVEKAALAKYIIDAAGTITVNDPA